MAEGRPPLIPFMAENPLVCAHPVGVNLSVFPLVNFIPATLLVIWFTTRVGVVLPRGTVTGLPVGLEGCCEAHAGDIVDWLEAAKGFGEVACRICPDGGGGPHGLVFNEEAAGGENGLIAAAPAALAG